MRHHHALLISLIAGAMTCVCPRTDGQQLIGLLDVADVNANFGTAVAPAGDIDGDGVPDLLVSAPVADAAGFGRVRILAAPGMALIAEFQGVQADDGFGQSVGMVGDVNLDGQLDFFIAAPSFDTNMADNGRVAIYSGIGPLAAQVGPPGSRFGTAVVAIGDFQADGADDVLAGAPGSGLIRVLSGSNAASLLQLSGPAGSAFGTRLAAGGDVNGDGIADFAASAVVPRVISVFSGLDATVLRQFPVAPDSPLVRSMAFVGDVDGDSAADLFYGSTFDPGVPTAPAIDTAELLSGATGQVLQSFVGSPGSPAFDPGFAVAGVGDVNMDGRPDFMSGGPGAVNAANGNIGKVWIWSGQDGSVLYEMDASIAGEMNSQDGFGWSVCALGDIDGNGIQEIAIGAPGKSPGGRVLLVGLVDTTPPTDDPSLIELGDTVSGAITGFFEKDRVGFVGLAGSKLKLKLSAEQPMHLQAAIVTVSGVVLQKWQVKIQSSIVAKEFLLPVTGTYGLVISGVGGSQGSYRIDTDRKLPAVGKDQQFKLKGATGHDILLAALSGTMLKLAVLPKEGVPPVIELLDPDGQAIDLAPFLIETTAGTLVSGVPLEVAGAYTLWLSGIQDFQQKIKVKVDLDQPQGNAVVAVD